MSVIIVIVLSSREVKLTVTREAAVKFVSDLRDAKIGDAVTLDGTVAVFRVGNVEAAYVIPLGHQTYEVERTLAQPVFDFITQSNAPFRIYRAARRQGLVTVRDVVGKSRDWWLKQGGVGHSTVRGLETCLKTYGLKLGGNDDETIVQRGDGDVPEEAPVGAES